MLAEMSNSSGKKRNALAKSRSPYLLQHTSNPVDWREWGEEAFAEARERGVPIFLSIGYSTCHWCHVMAHESFEDEGIAGRMNDLFVNVKLDREERPDVDRIYMSYVQSTTGSGGWPMSVWLTPDLKPFYGGTYFPPEDKYGRVGFLTLVERIGQLWRDERATLLEYGEKSQALLADSASRNLSDGIGEAAGAIDLCLEQLDTEYDEQWGGFGGAPKFPMPGYFQMLVDGISRRGNARLTEMLAGSLEKMADGGIWDHVGSGFHRYSVDKYWHVPHYEKMLYDQGQLAGIYAEAYRLTGRDSFAAVAKGIVRYVARDLQGAAGELFAAEDADSALPDDASKHGEGAFYVWSKAELDGLLGEDAALFASAYDVKAGGNARPESDPHGELKGMNTLMRVASDGELGKRFSLEVSAVRERLGACLGVLFEKRDGRPRPHLDDKALVSWNALMISGACKVYQACGDADALELAKKAAVFLFAEMWDAGEGRFARVYRGGCGEQGGFAEDYAAAAGACLDLYEATFDAVWVERAREVLQQLKLRFWDEQRGGFFATEVGDANVLVRLRDDYDGAEPAASSLAALALLRLAALLDDEKLRVLGRETIEAFGEQWKRSPRAMPLMLVAASRFLESDQQIVVVGDLEAAETRELIACANRWRASFSVLVGVDPAVGLPEVFGGNEKLKAMLEVAEAGKPLVYVCENFACKEPVGSVESLEGILR
ncbi:conserved hypothetical protein [Verrucomicrobiia bacterium DG1235]|nr:conserved hypothetical protein [Verrucomicrobiae bacterium DG1235]